MTTNVSNEIQIGSGRATDTSNKNEDFFAALASTPEPVEDTSVTTTTNTMSVADYMKDKQINGSQIFVDNTWTPVQSTLLSEEFITAITPLLKYLESRGMIQILNPNTEYYQDDEEVENTTGEEDEVVSNIIQEIIGDVDTVKEEFGDDIDAFLNKYYEPVYNYLISLGYSDDCIDDIANRLLDRLFI